MSATVLMLPASTISLSAKLCHFPVRGRGVRGDARTPRLDAHNHHLPSLPRRGPLSRLASLPHCIAGGGDPATRLGGWGFAGICVSGCSTSLADRGPMLRVAGLTRRFALRAASGEDPRRLPWAARSEEHTSELQSRRDLVCRLL